MNVPTNSYLRVVSIDIIPEGVAPTIVTCGVNTYNVSYRMGRAMAHQHINILRAVPIETLPLIALFCLSTFPSII